MMMLKTRWQDIKTKGYPPRDDCNIYGDRFSIPVLIGDSESNEGHVLYKAYVWDYNNNGWVEYDYIDGTEPDDYELYIDVDHWAHWPKCKLVCLD